MVNGHFLLPLRRKLSIAKFKMKKLITIIAILLLVACTANGPSVGEKEAAIYREYTEKVKAAQSIEDIAQIENESGIEDRITELLPEWRALINGTDSSAYYAEMAKTQGAKDTLKMVTEAKLTEFIKNIKFE